MRLGRSTAIAGLALGVAGCGTAHDRDAARDVAAGLYSAVARHDGRAACRRLGPPTVDSLEQQAKAPCEKAVSDLQLHGGRIASVEVFQTDAMVQFAGGERAYLERRQGGWKVSAAGCKPQPAGPAQCEVED
ncbi:MAG: hypothetical protein QOJ97_1587 [Solirubrobacteraceae bacterium]|jgi:hypothetical protein|nr:hypothetical protein [Solirubrobacteraceae bacterium]